MRLLDLRRRLARLELATEGLTPAERRDLAAIVRRGGGAAAFVPARLSDADLVRLLELSERAGAADCPPAVRAELARRGGFRGLTDDELERIVEGEALGEVLGV